MAPSKATISAVLDAGSAQRIVDSAGIVFSVATCTRLNGGDNSATYDLFDAAREAHLVAKVYGERMAWKMRKEVLVYALLASVLCRPRGSCSLTTAGGWLTQTTP